MTAQSANGYFEVGMAKKVWYALRAQSEREEKIKEGLLAKLRAKGIESMVPQIIVPAENVSEIREGKKRVSQQKMFPGYILIEVDAGEQTEELPQDVWFAVMDTPGISGFVGGSRLKPVPLDETEVRRIIDDIEARKEKPKPKMEFQSGDRVRIKEGSFENFDGTVESVDSTKWMLKVRVSIFGRDTSVELEYGKVEKI
jgi:transcriptional antiterminator NusG